MVRTLTISYIVEIILCGKNGYKAIYSNKKTLYCNQRSIELGKHYRADITSV